MTQDDRENSLIANVQFLSGLLDQIHEDWQSLNVVLLEGEDFEGEDRGRADEIFSANPSTSAVILYRFGEEPKGAIGLSPGVDAAGLQDRLLRHASSIFDFEQKKRRVEFLLAEASAAGGLQRLGAAEIGSWEKVKSADMDGLQFRSIVLFLVFGGSIKIKPGPRRTIDEILKDAFARLVNDPKLNDYHEAELEGVKYLIGHEIFRPDDWWQRSKILTPVMGDDIDSRLPGSIRQRLKEIYRSYLFGNFLAVIALSRATLEYAMIDKGASLGIVTAEQDGKSLKLGAMIDVAAAIYPELSEHLEGIREAGNKTLHPQRKERLFLNEGYVEEVALRTLTGLRFVLEGIYKRRSKTA